MPDPKYVPAPDAPSPLQMQKAAMLGDFLRLNDDLISPWKFDRRTLIGRQLGRLNRDWGETTVRLANQKQP